MSAVLAAPFLAADKPTSPRKTRVGGFGRCSAHRAPRNTAQVANSRRVSAACGYKTASGRAWFINKDPIEEQGGLNLYAFVGNDGVNRWDYLGMWPDRPGFWPDGFMWPGDSQSPSRLGDNSYDSTFRGLANNGVAVANAVDRAVAPLNRVTNDPVVRSAIALGLTGTVLMAAAPEASGFAVASGTGLLAETTSALWVGSGIATLTLTASWQGARLVGNIFDPVSAASMPSEAPSIGSLRMQAVDKILGTQLEPYTTAATNVVSITQSVNSFTEATTTLSALASAIEAGQGFNELIASGNSLSSAGNPFGRTPLVFSSATDRGLANIPASTVEKIEVFRDGSVRVTQKPGQSKGSSTAPSDPKNEEAKKKKPKGKK